MTKTPQRIRDIAEQLPAERQQVLLDIAEGLARPSRFYDSLTAEQARELEQALAEANRNESIGSDELERRLNRVTGHHDR